MFEVSGRIDPRSITEASREVRLRAARPIAGLSLGTHSDTSEQRSNNSVSPVQFLAPLLCFALALGLLAASEASNGGSWFYFSGIALYPVACLWWVMACADAGPWRSARALLAMIPALLPVGLSALALSVSDIAIMGILSGWPFTLVSPLVSILGGIWLMSGRYIPPDKPGP